MAETLGVGVPLAMLAISRDFAPTIRVIAVAAHPFSIVLSLDMGATIDLTRNQMFAFIFLYAQRQLLYLVPVIYKVKFYGAGILDQKLGPRFL